MRIHRRSAIAAGAAGVAALLNRHSFAERSRDVPWLSEIQQPPKTLPADAPKLSNLLVGDDGQRITGVAGWQERRAELRRWWLSLLGRFPAERRGAPRLEIIEEDRTDGVVRQLVKYEVEPGITTDAYLLKPVKIERKAAAIAVFHTTSNYTIRQPAGLEGPPEKHFGLHFAKQGCVCLCPRNFLWPKISAEKLNARVEAQKYLDRVPGSTGMAKMLHDSLVAVDCLASLPEVDAERIGSVGHSLGAKETLYLAAFDERVKAAVSSEGGVGTKFSNWQDIWYLGDEVNHLGNHEQHELLALAAPRPFLLVGGNSADGDRGWPFIEAALPVYELYGKPARLGQFNHGQGHSVPPIAEQRIAEWLLTYL